MADSSISQLQQQFADNPTVLAIIDAAAKANPTLAATQGIAPAVVAAAASPSMFATSPSRLSTAGLFANNTESSQALASGFPMLAQMIDFFLRSQQQNLNRDIFGLSQEQFGLQKEGQASDIALQQAQLVLQQNADRRSAIDQSINIARMMADLERVSPTRAAAMAASLGVKPDDAISFTNLFGTGTNFPQAGGKRVSGTIGGVPISLPSVFSGKELSFLNSNPNVARVALDVADALGVPDIFSRSAAARIPVMSGIFSGGI